MSRHSFSSFLSTCRYRSSSELTIIPLAHFGVQYVLLIYRQLDSVLLFTIGLLQVGHNLINYDIAQIVELSYTHRVQKATQQGMGENELF